MCDPITLGSLAIVTTVAAGGISANAAIQQGKFQKGMANYQATLNRNRAERAIKAGEFSAADTLQRRQQLAATGQTAFAANGILLDASPTSAPNMWDQDQAAARAFEVANIRDSARAEAWGYETNAQMQILQGSMDRRAASSQAWGSMLSASASAFSQGASMSSGGGDGGSKKKK